MFVISEDGMRAIPLESFMLSIEEFDRVEFAEFSEYELSLLGDHKKYALVATMDPDGSFLFLGAYRKKESAVFMLNQIMHTYASEPKNTVVRLVPEEEKEKSSNDPLIIF